MSINDAVGYLV